MMLIDSVYTEIEVRYEDVNGVEQQTMVGISSDTLRAKLHIGSSVRGNPDEICQLMAEIASVIWAHAEALADKEIRS